MPAAPAYAVTDAELLPLEQALAATAHQGALPAQLEAMVALAWQLRQRQPQRAQQLRQQAEALLPQAGLTATVQARLAARCRLIEAESRALAGEQHGATALSQQVLLQALRSADAVTAADARLLLASLAADRGEYDELQRELEHVMVAMHSRDPLRHALAQCKQAHAELLQDLASAEPRWAARLRQLSVDAEPALTAWVSNCQGIAFGLHGALGRSAQRFIESCRAAEQTGQLLLAAHSATNAATSFELMHAHESAFEWSQRALELARLAGAHDAQTRALLRSAAALRALGRQDTARTLTAEALQLLEPRRPLREWLMAGLLMAEFALDEGRHAEALALLHDCEQQCRALGSAHVMAEIQQAQARAYLALGRQAAGLQLTQRMLDASGARHLRVDTLELRAKLLLLAEPGAMPTAAAQTAAFEVLQQALQLAEQTEGFVPQASLYEALAQVSTGVGDRAQAYAYTVQAGQAQERRHHEQAVSRASAIELAQQTARARDEHARAQEQAQRERERVQALQRLQATLQSLGDIGRDISAQQDQQTLLATLKRHVQKLLDVATFAVFRLDPGGASLSMVYGVEAGIALPERVFALDDEQRNVPRCARERCEIVVDDEPPGPLVFAGTRHTPSKLYAPLLAGQRLLGVLTVQSFERHAYGEHERAIFRNLAAYAAIALANADASQELQQAQSQLADQERLASLGQLVANVAHEINTPMAVVKSSGESIADGLTHSLARLPALLLSLDEASKAALFGLVEQARQQAELLSSREERNRARALSLQLQAQGIADARRQADLLLRLRAQDDWLALLPMLRHPRAAELLGMADGLATLVRSAANINTAVTRMAKIAFALRRYAAPSPPAEALDFELRGNIEQALHSYQHLLRQGVELALDLERGLYLRGQPDELVQVWGNLIHNALQAMKQQGRLSLRCSGNQEWLEVEIADTGCGIPEAALARIFEPFFSTKPSGEGSGLGLDIASKIIQRHRGKISVQSVPGQGSCFLVRLPRLRDSRP
ncbi:ATP-binding protein [Paucibacter sp. APW11]|uniref:histidine kinase n=1 Tax=Roseateles aquae TaxID=3077235 RepID=A0ABU3PHM9_9BURK|nr:ATP-binding protein [Paucibacter sp. APW11]MDT9002079.1 ATP-binding protein [Paucibacter sp. APW11]